MFIPITLIIYVFLGDLGIFFSAQKNEWTHDVCKQLNYIKYEDIFTCAN